MMRELRMNERLPRDGKPYLNPIWLMSDSGARGNVDQIRQLGRHAWPDGQARRARSSRRRSRRTSAKA